MNVQFSSLEGLRTGGELLVLALFESDLAPKAKPPEAPSQEGLKKLVQKRVRRGA